MTCKRSREIDIDCFDAGQLVCQTCDRLISVLDTSPFSSWIDKEVDRKRDLQASGQLKTRIQTNLQDDQEIDRDGLHAEIAACLVLCPHRLLDWQNAATSNQNNRGGDLPSDWTGLSKPIEIKFTRYFSSKLGYLLVRPPSGQGKAMKPDFIDDAYYLLLTRQQGMMQVLGWIDRTEFLARKKIDPVGRSAAQVECWGVLWRDLIGLSRLERSRCTNFLKLDTELGR